MENKVKSNAYNYWLFLTHYALTLMSEVTFQGFIQHLQYDYFLISYRIFQHQIQVHLIRFFCNIYILISYLKKMTKTLIAILLLILQASCLILRQRTPQNVKETFKKFDKDSDGFLSKSEARSFFDKQYMADFEGIDIDPKFVQSSFNHILNSDTNKNGIQVQEFIEAIVPKSGDYVKKEPEYYPEQEL